MGVALDSNMARPPGSQFLKAAIERIPLSTLLIVSMIGLVIATALGVALLTLHNLDAALVPFRMQLVAQQARARVEDVVAYAGSARADVQVLSESDALNGLLRAIAGGGMDPVDRVPSAVWQDRLTKRLLREIEAKPAYYQVRVISAADGGRELVRVDRDYGSPRRVAQQDLQRKGETEYFRKTMSLGPGEIYVSSIELNKELGRVETPVVPVVRIATPLFLPDGQRFGIFIINLDLRPIFERLKSRAPAYGDIRLVNANGDYLLHPDDAKAFRFEYGERSRAEDDLPEVTLLPSETKLQRDRNGQLVGVAVATGRIADVLEFSVVEVAPYAALAAAPAPLRDATIVAGSVAALASIVMALLIAHALSRRIRFVVESVDGLSSEELDIGAPLPGGGSSLYRLLRIKQPVQELHDELVRRRRAELLMRQYLEKHSLYSAVVQSATDAIVTKTLDGKITGWNYASEKLFGFSAEEAVGQPIEIIVPPDRLSDVQHILGRIAQNETVDHYETVRKTKDGRLIDVSLSVSPVKSADGEVIGAAKIARDISERKFIERKFELAVEASPGGVLMIDGAGVIILMNKELERQFGYERAELIGRSVETLLPASGRMAHARVREAFLNAPAVRSMGAGRELFARRKDGTEFPVEIGLNPIQSRDGLIVLASVVDISARRQAERAIQTQKEQLQHAQKMEAVGLMAGGVAHDFNNLLLVMLVYAEMLRADCDALDPKLPEIMEIVKSIDRAQLLTGQLLAFCRKQPSEPSVLNLGEVVSGFHSMLRRTLPADIEIVTIVADDLWPVLVDKGQLEQVLMNLAVNARDAMPAGGRFAIEIANKQDATADSENLPGDFVEVRVSDSGTGIAPELIEKIFDPFFTTKERGRGTGLGLSTCYGIIAQAGGRLTVQSELGKGATFCILLPRTERLASMAATASKDIEQFGGKETILVVEDDQAVMRATTAALKRGGYGILTAANGDEARRLLLQQSGGIDLVLSDVVMPQLSGPELAEFVRNSCPGLPLIFMTGYSDYPVITESGDHRIAHHRAIMKPFRPNELLATIREVLDGREGSAPS
ncbi:PAS domain S-box protein [Bradyrhizobium japonicum]|uniref:PAS domain S-box protein n=1 Tax=Bradyrhizobium japonicum TaxID=375 RepID=UPI001BA4E6D2|nr:PAS domain S-box protein [Bradyrhizobium japonicum]MBR0993101.1 PAS domain S-box protein [Bradyrhizobium japonicum]